MISDCSQSENSSANGTKGDQTQKEYSIRAWYDFGWDYVLRHPNTQIQKYIQQNAIAAAQNDNIGYGQSDRDTFWDELVKVNYDASKITTPCNADCSSSTCAVCKAAGYLSGDTKLQGITLGTTRTIVSILSSAGFQILQDIKYLKSKDYLIPGDVLLNSNKHACIYVGNTSATSSVPLVSDGSNVYIVGDSITVGSTNAIKSKLPKAEVNALTSSWFSRDSSRLPSGLTRLNNIGSQSILVFAMGTNGGINQSDIDKLLAFVSQRSSIQKVVLMTIYYNTSVSRYSGQSVVNQMNSSNALVTSTASSNPNVSYFDWYGAVSNDPSTYILSDGVHPTSAGQQKFAELIASAVGGLSGSSFSGSYAGGTNISMFSSTYEVGDAMVREFCYLSKKLERTLGKTNSRLSVINYAPLVENIAQAQGIYLTAASAFAGNMNVDTSQLDGNCRIIVDYLISKGLNGAAACGVVGNIYHESRFSTSAVGDGGTSFGICQWHAGRGTNMKNFVGANWANNLTGQCDYLWYDLNTNYPGVLNHLKSVPNTVEGAKSAADYFVRHFEIPSGIEQASRTRQATAADYFNQLVMMPSSFGATVQGNLVSHNGKSLTLQKTIQVPESVQYGLLGNYTNYSYWFSRWGWKCRTIADIWAQKGRTSSKGIATIDGHYLVAMSSKFANTGDLVVIHLKNGESFSAILGDSKGSDAGSEWGHIVSGNLVDIIEWEAIGSSTSAAGGTNIQLGSWSGVKVSSVDNYGAWLD